MMSDRETNQNQKTRKTFFYGYVIVIAISIIQIVMFGSRNTFGIFFKPLLTEFGWTRALISGAFSMSSVAQGFSGVLMGSLNDRIGPRAVMTISGLLIGAGFFLMSVVDSVWELYLFYTVMVGIGLGSMFVPQMSTVARWFSQKRNTMTGVVAAAGGIGGLILPPVINWLISEYGWRFAYIIIGALILVVTIIASQFLKRDPYKMGLMPYGETKNKEPETRRPNSGLRGLSFKQTACTRQFWMILIMVFCFGYCLQTIIVHIVPHVTDLGISAAAAANILATMSVALTAGSFALGVVADKIGSRKAFTICFIFIIAIFFLIMPITQTWMFVLFCVLIAIGSGGAATLESTVLAELFGLKSHGIILGVTSLSYTFGAALGPFMAGYIFDISGSYQMAFIVSGILAVLGFFISTGLRPVKTRQITEAAEY